MAPIIKTQKQKTNESENARSDKSHFTIYICTRESTTKGFLKNYNPGEKITTGNHIIMDNKKQGSAGNNAFASQSVK